MRPLVNLIRHHPDPAEREPEDCGRASPSPGEWHREETEQNRNRKKSDVTVGLDEASPEEIFGIDMVHAKGDEKALSDHREIVAPPGVGAPVNEPGSEIGRGHSSDKRKRNPPLPQIKPRRDAKPQRSEQQKSRGQRDAREEKLRPRQLIMKRQPRIRSG